MHQIQDKQRVIFRDLGRIPFEEAWELQTRLNQTLIDAKRARESDGQPHFLLFCEHPPVYTLGKSGSEDHLRIDPNTRERLDVEYFRINRGGDITFHGPGQVVGYPIFDLDRFFTDVHRYIRSLEEVVIRLLQLYGISGERLADHTGVWVRKGASWSKLCAIGVHLSRWVTMHGFALNVDTNLSYFSHIIPCGIDAPDKSVTTMTRETGEIVAIEEVKQNLRTIFAEVFDFSYTEE